MYATTLQFDVLFRLKELTENYELTFEDAKNLNEDILEKFFHDVIAYSIIGIYQYHPYRTYRENKVKHNPILFTWDWFCDIFDYEKDIVAKRVFKKVIREYYDVTHFNQYCQPMNGELNLTVLSSLDDLKKYALNGFDMEAMYQYGVMNEEKYTNLFDKNKKYYFLSNNAIVNGNVIYNEYTYDELFELIKNNFRDCVFVDEGYLFVYTNDIHGRIVAEDYFDNFKTIEEYLDSISLDKLDLHAIKYMVYMFGKEKICQHKTICKYFENYDFRYAEYFEVDMMLSINTTKNQIERCIKGCICKGYRANTMIELIKDCEDINKKRMLKEILMNFLNDYIGD